VENYTAFLVGHDQFGLVNFRGSKSFQAKNDKVAIEHVRNIEKNYSPGSMKVRSLMKEVKIK
jgi:hypothetical protein